MRLITAPLPHSPSGSSQRSRSSAARAGGADRAHFPRSVPPRTPNAPIYCARRSVWAWVLLICPLVVLALVVSAAAAHGQPQQPPGQGEIAGNVDTVFDNIRTWIMGILAGLATVFLTVGGVRYLMASGDPGEVEKAKTCFKSAGWGYGLAALAPLVVEILKGIVGPG